ncbi:flagellar hook-length control protein FliK [Thalassospiraceae bacterium LMO-JJ14]|nr:flagellar hook-length control protein FliK [Thalassospiraceae bacterium LMO-JJ14]
MTSLAIEQKLQEHGYQSGGTQQAAPNQIHLGGFAVSFEDLLQRVGARLDNAFSAADKSGGIAASNENANVNNEPREYPEARDSAGDHGHQRNNDDASDHGRTTAADARDNGADRGADAPRSDHAADNASSRADNADRDAHGAHEGKDTADQGPSDDTANGDNATEAAANDSNDGNDSDKPAEKPAEAANTDGGANQNASQQGHNASMASAVYAAGLVGNKGGETANSAQSDTLTQAQKGADVSDNPVVQAAAAKAGKNAQGNHSNAERGQKDQNKAANAGEQKTAGNEQKSTATNTQNQAQQLSRVIGNDTRANINVNITNEQNQLTSKPAFTIANGSVLTQAAGNGKGNASNAQNAQQQGQNQGQSQQAQLAAQQQAQTAQQTNMQNAQQGAQTGAGKAAATAATSIQTASGGAQQAGGNEAMNNPTQGANAAQQTQQTQQAREAAPHQQAQHAQRGNLPGSAVTEQISVKITKALQTGTDKISIQLKPAELGRVDVKMEMTHDGRVMTVVTAEKQDTLDLLRRDSSELQKALADAGLNSGDMEFNLKGQEQQSAEAEDNAKNNPANMEAEAEADADAGDGVMSAWESGIFANGRFDLRA